MLHPTNDMDVLKKRQEFISFCLKSKNKYAVDEITSALKKTRSIIVSTKDPTPSQFAPELQNPSLPGCSDTNRRKRRRNFGLEINPSDSRKHPASSENCGDSFRASPLAQGVS